MLNRIKLNESELKKIVENSICNILNEYHAEQRLPFDDDFYGKKNQLEQYKDWLEDFGKYGELPPSSLNFYDELKKALKIIETRQLHGRFDANTPKSSSGMFYKLNGVMFRYLEFDNNGNLYVERSILLDTPAENVLINTYRELVKNYNDNVGGCWSYKKGASRAYCGIGKHTIVFRGKIRVEDIDFVKTALLNFEYSDEHEIRVKPNSKVALDSFSYDKYTVKFDTPLIVSATYFGNNGQFYGDYAGVDDGFGNSEYVDRKGNKFSKEVVMNKLINNIHNQLDSGKELEDVFTDVYYGRNGIDMVFYDFLGKDKINFVKDNRILSPYLWFDDAAFFKEGLAKISVLDKDSCEEVNYINENGELLVPNMWFDEGESFENGIARVGKYEKGTLYYTLLKNDGTLLVNDWFVLCYRYKNGLICVAAEKGKKMSWQNSKPITNVNHASFDYYILTEDGTCLNDRPLAFCDPLRGKMVLVRTNDDEGNVCYKYFNTETRTFIDY